MKIFLLPTFLLLAAVTMWSTLTPVSAPPPVETSAETSPAPLPEPTPERIVLEDSVVIWVDELADLRPVRPYRTGEEVPQAVEIDTSDSFVGQKPQSISWQLLTDIRYVLTYNKKVDMEVYAPIFPDTIKNLAGKLVRIRGYIIPFDDDQATVALSANPYAACFFCGKASPASVLTLRFAGRGKRYKLDAHRTFKGKLRLNYDDPDEFYYVLDEAREL